MASITTCGASRNTPVSGVKSTPSHTFRVTETIPCKFTAFAMALAARNVHQRGLIVQDGGQTRAPSASSILTRDTAGVPKVFKQTYQVLPPSSGAAAAGGPRRGSTAGSLATHGIRPLEEHDEPKRCWVDPRQVATRQCFSCAKFDPHGTGYYCEESFITAHPWCVRKSNSESLAVPPSPQCAGIAWITTGCTLSRSLPHPNHPSFQGTNRRIMAFRTCWPSHKSKKLT